MLVFTANIDAHLRGSVLTRNGHHESPLSRQRIRADAYVAFDRVVAERYVRYAHMLAARGFETFTQDTNCIVMKRHGITVLGHDGSECYRRVNVYASEVKRQITVELLCAAKGTTPEYITKEEME